MDKIPNVRINTGSCFAWGTNQTLGTSVKQRRKFAHVMRIEQLTNFIKILNKQNNFLDRNFAFLLLILF